MVALAAPVLEARVKAPVAVVLEPEPEPEAKPVEEALQAWFGSA